MSFLGSLTLPLVVAVLLFAVIYFISLVMNEPRGIIFAAIVAALAFLITLKKAVLKTETEE